MATSLSTANLKLPKYAGTDKADLVGGYNASMDIIDQLIGKAGFTYFASKYTDALPSGFPTPCLVYGISDGILAVEDGKTSTSDEPATDGPGAMGDEGGSEEPGVTE